MGLVDDRNVKGFLDFIYSDVLVVNSDEKTCSFLSDLAIIPIVGRIAGPIRIIGGIVHSILHLLAALVTSISKNKDTAKIHCWHALKGMTELLRGVIESIPIIGWLFVVVQDKHWELWRETTKSHGHSAWAFFIIRAESKIPSTHLPPSTKCVVIHGTQESWKKNEDGAKTVNKNF